MPITSHVDTAKNLTIFAATGVPTFGEVLIAVDRFYAGNPTKNVLWEWLETTDVHLTPEDMERIASYQPRYDERREAGKTAFVAKGDSFFELSMAFKLQSEARKAPYSIEVFRSNDEAHQWLDEP